MSKTRPEPATEGAIPHFPLQSDTAFLGWFTRSDLIQLRQRIDDLLSAPFFPGFSHPVFDPIVTAVANFYHVSPSLLWGRSQARKAAWPRQVAIALCCERFPHVPARDIATAFQRSESTICHAREVVLDSQRHPQTRADLHRLRQLLSIATPA